MDFDDFDEPSKAPPKPSRFAPKSSRFQSKSKPAKMEIESKVKPPSKVESEAAPPPPTPPVIVKEEEDANSLSTTTAKMDVDEEVPAKNDGDVELKEEEEEEREIDETWIDVMEDEEEDHVVAEYDVYFTPRDPSNQWYLLQYPLRPSWRPYELDQRCTEVRVKPNSGEMEVDLSIDINSDNHDPKSDAHGKMTKQILSSSTRPPLASSYAVGVLSGKKLYVNPVHSIVQLRPSLDHWDSGGSKKRNNPNITVKEEGSNNGALAGPPRKQKKNMDPEVVKSWICLKYHSSTTELAERYLRKMVTEQKDPLQFYMNPYDYLNSLCPGVVINKMKSSGPSKRSLLSLPLDVRLKTMLVEGPSVQRFTAIKHLAPDDPVEKVLEVLQENALLVQGLWVAKPRIRHPNAQGAERLARDYVLLLFSQSPVIKESELDILGSSKSTGKAVLREIAVERPYCKDWKFKESTDVSFLKLYPDVVEQQKKLWQAHEPEIMGQFAKRRLPMKAERAATSIHSGSSSMSKETQEALPKMLENLFQTHKVCSFQAICQGLKHIKDFEAPQEELIGFISKVAVFVHGVYLLKESSEHPELNPLRDVVIQKFIGRGPNAKLKKGEIIEAAKIKLKKEPTNNEFQKVINEYCVSKGGAWVLKSGDGVLK